MALFSSVTRTLFTSESSAHANVRPAASAIATTRAKRELEDRIRKVWKKGDPEPGEWSITYEDPIVVQKGAPGIYGDSRIDVYYDNVTVKVNE